MERVRKNSLHFKESQENVFRKAYRNSKGLKEGVTPRCSKE